MHLATALYGLACFATCVLVVKDGARSLVALALAEAWVVATLAWHLGVLGILPLLDLSVALAVLIAGNTGRWSTIVMGMTGVRLACHVGACFGAPYGFYAITLNLTFAVMLAALVAEGATDAARRLGDRLSARFRRDRSRAFRPLAAAQMAAE